MTIQPIVNEINDIACNKEEGYFIKDVHNNPVLILPMILKGKKQQQTRCFISVDSKGASLTLGHLSNSAVSCVLCNKNESFTCSYEHHQEEIMMFILQKEAFQQTLQYFRINAALKGINVESLLLKGECK